MMTELTDRERHVMRHALGLNNASESYRNYFDAGEADQPTWERLVERGLATKREIEGRERPIYHVTEQGEAELGD